ncbi:TonB-dependent receptor [Salinimicrobium xinjiangense]|uniref:TonB-dependent receptor n=1 Tax=Salinimicrobium xinjiangense TaxID=438596 RepID=UPI0004072A56|nr:TonB-dependent receptor [Salinimicrobium xinjiangense]
MKQTGLALFILYFLPFCAAAQSITLEGRITDEKNQPLEHAHVHFGSFFSTSDKQGNYHISHITKGTYNLNISFLGFKQIDTVVSIEEDLVLNFTLKEDAAALEEIVLTGLTQRSGAENKERVNREYLQDQFTGSLAKTLDRLPGVNSVEIGAGTSKPIIRGLGFNRVAVTEQGIKQEGQQWGADHGLEIDALNVENIEVIKGVGAIEHGSDAMGGVIKIINDQVPQKGFSGEVLGLAHSVNNRLTSAANLTYRKNRFFYKTKATLSEFGDYSVPTDSIVYLNFNIPVYNQELKNTAGKEVDLYGQIGYIAPHYKGTLSLSNVYFKSGFFPGAHGIPSVGRVRDDGDKRNIDFPFQKVNHLKAISKNQWFYHDYTFELILGFQNNHRQEWSLFHTHYSGQEPPEVNPNLELDFDLNTYDAQVKVSRAFSNGSKSTIGVQGQIQDNSIGGYNFLLPEYFRTNTGIFLTHEFDVTEKLRINLGTRFDYSQISVEEYYDGLLFEYLTSRGRSELEASQYAQRSPELKRDFSNFNAMTGLLYNINENWDFSVNTGTSFRLPTAIELGANGIHHGSFRHERGDADLDAEKGYVFDTKLNYNKDSFRISASPYLYYFDNYIFLNPSGVFSVLPHSGQTYQFTQSEALLTGIELELEKRFFEKLHVMGTFEYLYNRQVTGDSSRNYPLPFTPPANGFAEVSYTLSEEFLILRKPEIFANTSFALEQDRIAQQEKITPGYQIFGGGIKTGLQIGKLSADLNLRVTNLFNHKYFNHTSFYRALEIPEMGRNIQLMLRIPIK